MFFLESGAQGRRSRPREGIWPNTESNNFSTLGVPESDVNRHPWYTVWYTVLVLNVSPQTSIYQHAPGVILRVTQTHLWLWTLRDSEGVNDSVWLLKRHTESFCKVSVIWLSMREEHQIKDPTQEKHRPVYRDIYEGRMREIKSRGVLLMAHDHDGLFLGYLSNFFSGLLLLSIRPLSG